MPYLPAKGLKFRIQVSSMNCVGCGLCASECLGNKMPSSPKIRRPRTSPSRWSRPRANSPNKMAPITSISTSPIRANIYPLNTVKGVGFMMPYMEVSGLRGLRRSSVLPPCHQLFGKDMLVANATGCSSIYCGSDSAYSVRPRCQQRRTGLGQLLLRR
jgi:pyruvate-ferredoxin/flavodoxin oxidoreductase